MFPDTIPLNNPDDTTSTEAITLSTPIPRRNNRDRLTSALQHLAHSLTPNKAPSSYTPIPDANPDDLPPQPDRRQNPFLRCIATIKARREARPKAPWRQQTGNEWLADPGSYNWYLAGMYM